MRAKPSSLRADTACPTRPKLKLKLRRKAKRPTNRATKPTIKLATRQTRKQPVRRTENLRTSPARNPLTNQVHPARKRSSANAGAARFSFQRKNIGGKIVLVPEHFSAGSVFNYQPDAGWRLSRVQHSCFGFSQHRFPPHRDWRGQRRHAHRPDAGYDYQTYRR